MGVKTTVYLDDLELEKIKDFKKIYPSFSLSQILRESLDGKLKIDWKKVENKLKLKELRENHKRMMNNVHTLSNMLFNIEKMIITDCKHHGELVYEKYLIFANQGIKLYKLFTPLEKRAVKKELIILKDIKKKGLRFVKFHFRNQIRISIEMRRTVHTKDDLKDL